MIVGGRVAHVGGMVAVKVREADWVGRYRVAIAIVRDAHHDGPLLVARRAEAHERLRVLKARREQRVRRDHRHVVAEGALETRTTVELAKAPAPHGDGCATARGSAVRVHERDPQLGVLVVHEVGRLGLGCVGDVAVYCDLERAHRRVAEQRRAVIAAALAVDISRVEVPDAHVGREAENVPVVLPGRAHRRVGAAKEAEDGGVVDEPGATDGHERAAVVGATIRTDRAHRQAEREVERVVRVRVHRRARDEIILPVERERQLECLRRQVGRLVKHVVAPPERRRATPDVGGAVHRRLDRRHQVPKAAARVAQRKRARRRQAHHRAASSRPPARQH